MVVALVKTSAIIKTIPRKNSMPHGGYRPFDTSACHAAFPDFSYLPLEYGLKKMNPEIIGSVK